MSPNNSANGFQVEPLSVRSREGEVGGQEQSCKLFNATALGNTAVHWKSDTLTFAPVRHWTILGKCHIRFVRIKSFRFGRFSGPYLSRNMSYKYILWLSCLPALPREHSSQVSWCLQAAASSLNLVPGSFQAHAWQSTNPIPGASRTQQASLNPSPGTSSALHQTVPTPVPGGSTPRRQPAWQPPCCPSPTAARAVTSADLGPGR